MTRLGDFWTLGNFLKPLGTINCPNLPTFLDNFCKGVKIYHFWVAFIDIWQFFSGHTGWKIVFDGVCWKTKLGRPIMMFGKPFTRVLPENTCRRGITVPMAGLLFDWFGFSSWNRFLQQHIFLFGQIKSCYTGGVISGQSYNHFTIVNYDSSVVIWGIFKSGTTLEA